MRVSGAVPGGLSVQVEDPTRLLVDRTAEFGAPAAASAPTACVIPGLGVHNIAYRDTSGRLHELWRDANGQTGTSNLTQLAGAPTAAGNPFAPRGHDAKHGDLAVPRRRRQRAQPVLVDRPVGHDDLSGTAGAPQADGDPVGVLLRSRRHVPRRLPWHDDHLHELYWAGVAPVGYGGNLTGTIGAPKAAGTPSGFINAGGVNIVAYRSVDGRILSVYWAEGPAGSTTCQGRPAHHSPPATRWATTRRTTTPTRSSTAASTITSTSCTGPVPRPLPAGTSPPPPGRRPRPGTRAFYHAPSNVKHVIYRSADGGMHQLWWDPAVTRRPG